MDHENTVLYPYVGVWRHEIWTHQRMAEFTALGNKAQHVVQHRLVSYWCFWGSIWVAYL